MLDLRDNQFCGTLPATFMEGNSIKSITLNRNRLEGPLPQALISCTNLEVLDLGNNNISDIFPHWIDTFTRLQVLVLRSNRFRGIIPLSKTELPFPKLRIVDLSNNAFTGPLPSYYFKKFEAMKNVYEKYGRVDYMGYNASYYQDSVELVVKGMEVKLVRILMVYTTIDMSNNKFEGKIPHTIGMLSSLRFLNLSHNHLTGHIPASLANLSVLESLDLSSNRMSGEIPWQLTGLTFLAVLNLSQNYLVGAIPQGKQFNTFGTNSFQGNLALCGSPLTKKCRDDEASLVPTLSPEQEVAAKFFNGFSRESVLIGYGFGMLFGLTIGYLIFLTGKPKWIVRIVEREQNRKGRRSRKSGQIKQLVGRRN